MKSVIRKKYGIFKFVEKTASVACKLTTEVPMMLVFVQLDLFLETLRSFQSPLVGKPYVGLCTLFLFYRQKAPEKR